MRAFFSSSAPYFYTNLGEIVPDLVKVRRRIDVVCVCCGLIAILSVVCV